jgi:hypothetical protein
MDRQFLLLAVIGISMINGLFSPFLVIARPIALVLMPEVFPRTINWVFYFSSILVASATLLFAGVPAALTERLLVRNRDSDIPMIVWLIGVVLLSLPALSLFLR